MDTCLSLSVQNFAYIDWGMACDQILSKLQYKRIPSMTATSKALPPFFSQNPIGFLEENNTILPSTESNEEKEVIEIVTYNPIFMPTVPISDPQNILLHRSKSEIEILLKHILEQIKKEKR